MANDMQAKGMRWRPCLAQAFHGYGVSDKRQAKGQQAFGLGHGVVG